MQQKELASGYVTTFFNDIENLTAQLAQYTNAILILNGKLADEESSFDDSDKQQLLKITQDMRFWLIRTYTHYKALLKSSIGFTDNPEITTIYKQVITTNIPSVDDIQYLCIEFNALFVSGVLSKYLEDNAKTFSEM